MLFTDEALDFLYINRINNSREWFAAHREDYRRLIYEPMARFTEYLTPTVKSIDPLIDCTPKIGKCLSRIYRDTRFSLDKSLYRDTAWCCFMRQKKLYNGLPGFFFEISPRQVRWGMGYYCASKEAMESLRSLVAMNHPLFLETAAMAQAHPELVLTGESYKRSRRPDLSAVQQDFINRKTVCFIRSLDISSLESPELEKNVETDFITLEAGYKLFMEAELRT